MRSLVALALLAGCAVDELEVGRRPPLEELVDQIPNDLAIANAAGAAASRGAGGFIDLAGPFHTPQGTNGRRCATCHTVEAGWSITPAQIEDLFALTDGTHPIFSPLDADRPDADLSTVEARRAAYGMLRRGLFRRVAAPPAGADFDGTFVVFRRPLTTANLRLITGNMWDDRLSLPAPGGGNDVHAGLRSQARGNVMGPQQGPPPADELVDAIVDGELGIAHAQVLAGGLRLDGCSGRGGPAHLAAQPLVAGRWDLYDAWIAGACSTRRSDEQRARIARGQELFNEKRSGAGARCRDCHDAANNGTNVAGRLFDIGTSRPASGLPVYTLRNRATGELRATTDPGQALVTGRWSDVDRFKVPGLRGIASRPPYFHNGGAATLRDVIVHYEAELGFDFTRSEEEDLVAFLEAL